MRFTKLEYSNLLARQAKVPPVPDDAVTRESKLHQQILDECNRRGWIALYSSMAFRTRRPPGEPDFIIIADRQRVFLVECKTAKGKLSREQAGFQMHSAKLGHTVHVVRSFSEFLAIIQSL